MLEHRLGLALGKTIGEIRQIPYPEFRRWRRYNVIEPIGWPNTEYQYGMLAHVIYNMNRSSKTKAKKPQDFMRDMVQELDRAISQTNMRQRYEQMSIEEKRAYQKKQLQSMLGSGRRRK